MNTTVVVVGCTAFIGVAAVVLITALRPGDNTQLIVTVLGFLAPTMMALIDTLKTNRVKNSLKSLHEKLDQVEEPK